MRRSDSSRGDSSRKQASEGTLRPGEAIYTDANGYKFNVLQEQASSPDTHGKTAEHSEPSSLKSPGGSQFPFDAQGIRGSKSDGTEQIKSGRQFAKDEGTYQGFGTPQQVERPKNQQLSFANASLLQTGTQDRSKGWSREGAARDTMTRQGVASSGGRGLHADAERSKRTTDKTSEVLRRYRQEQSYRPSEDRERFDDRD
jgi:hypothetical protein